MHRIAVFVGTRAEAIKLAPVVAALQGARGFDPVVIVAGQDGLAPSQILQRFGIEVHIELDVARPGQSLAGLTARLMEAIDVALTNALPDLALAQGDSTTVLCTALACFYRRIRLGHIEAGLRTGSVQSPFPEEANRTLVTRLTSLHLAPTERARSNLLAEGCRDASIAVTGNTIIDALDIELRRQSEPVERRRIDTDLLNVLGVRTLDRPYVLVTGSRRENFGRGFDEICRALQILAYEFPGHDFIYPILPNPNVRDPAEALLGRLPNVRLIPPQPYSNFVALLAGCRLALTDSGGVQEEAPRLGKPILVMREHTERPEGLESGASRLVGAEATKIIDSVRELLLDDDAYRKMAHAPNPYGDGYAASRIIQALLAFLG